MHKEAQLGMMIMKVFTTHLDQNLKIKMINIYKKQTNNKDTKPPNVFDYLKSLSQEANYLIDQMENADNDIDIYELVFIGSNKKKFNFNTFRMPLNFLSAIYNGEISLKEAEFKQRDTEKPEDVRGYRKNAEEEKKKR